MVIRFEGLVYKVLESTHRTPGNLRAFVQAKLRNVMTGPQHRAAVPVRGRHRRRSTSTTRRCSTSTATPRGTTSWTPTRTTSSPSRTTCSATRMSFVIPESTVTMDWFEGSRSASRSPFGRPQGRRDGARHQGRHRVRAEEARHARDRPRRPGSLVHQRGRGRPHRHRERRRYLRRRATRRALIEENAGGEACRLRSATGRPPRCRAAIRSQRKS